jgi:hypothetical protein
MLAMITARRIPPSYGPSQGAASIRGAVRALRAAGCAAGTAGPTLEVLRTRPDEPPRVEAGEPLEDPATGPRRVPGEPTPGFDAFLDGIQRSTVLAHVAGVPVVHGAVAAVVRVRRARRLSTWEAPVRSQALYAPRALLPAGIAAALEAAGPLEDTLGMAEGDPAGAGRHPQDLAARALTAVQRAREGAERTLLEAWVARGAGTLLVDGGISGSAAAVASRAVIGVVKSHRTLYATAEGIGPILALRAGERTPAVGLSSPRRHPVASFYLRLRDPGERGPFFGLVRLEIARGDAQADRRGDPPARGDDLTARADAAARRLLAERAPVALPDARWDVMTYGVRDCERYLAAILA